MRYTNVDVSNQIINFTFSADAQKIVFSIVIVIGVIGLILALLLLQGARKVNKIYIYNQISIFKKIYFSGLSIIFLKNYFSQVFLKIIVFNIFRNKPGNCSYGSLSDS